MSSSTVLKSVHCFQMAVNLCTPNTASKWIFSNVKSKLCFSGEDVCLVPSKSAPPAGKIEMPLSYNQQESSGGSDHPNAFRTSPLNFKRYVQILSMQKQFQNRKP